MSRRADGLLNHNYPGDDKGPQDACGVFGVWAPDEEVAKLTFYGLYALQHRGTESAGIATSDGDRIVVFKDMGLVSQVFTESDLATLPGDLAIGHTRYSTTGSSTWINAQPTLRPTKYGTLALAHNGNLTNTGDLAEMVAKLEPPAKNERGAIGKLERGWVVASESAALDIVGAAFVREVEPGEFLIINEDGIRSQMWAAPEPKGCIFEYVYLARPDTSIAGQSVHATRVRIGKKLAIEAPVKADLVIPVPESGTPAAIGYAQESGIPYGLGLVKNSYVGRTFIQPSQTIRQLGIRLKLNPLREIIEGKRIVVVDDSIVRGNTQRAIVRMLREAGALEIHVRISSPPVKWPCFYGIDFATRAELIASGLEVEEIRRSIGADSLGYVSAEGLIDATHVPAEKLCTACFTGQYPIAIPTDLSDGKLRLEILDQNP